MIHGRAKFSLEAVGAKIVACGGQFSPNVEVYSTADDQWTLIENGLLENHFYFGTIVKDGLIYIIGGSNDDGSNKNLLSYCVSIVDLDKATICRVSSILLKVRGHACALLKISDSVAGMSRVPYVNKHSA